ncbi:Response regulator of zinc sigma-54-dependent two-component system [Labilithrix luteola]|uniref:Response regulator of zinc sigma-54-dependent two-component system n=2 Tax=Labilithrix luteola TaxID=1391654 RepID=A0A0K1PYH3_9BACT|nr:Response regulator of zinc sigma-54-dependent two-component system [Labilithrix luteola]
MVVEDDGELRYGLSSALREAHFDVLEAASCTEAVNVFCASLPDAAVIDLRLPDGDAVDLLPRLRSVDDSVPIFIMTGHGTIDVAVRAVKEGAEDFLTKPFEMRSLVEIVGRAVERRRGRQASKLSRFAILPFEPRSAAMRLLEDEVERLRDSDCSVLLLGETGTGKSALARRIHALGARSKGPFVDVNCAGLNREFVESELFGHEKGAFTGAHVSKQGLLDAAHGGTLFLDEIGDIDLQVQPKVLKVVEEKRFRRMGDVKERSADVRLLAATHHDLLAATSRRAFRADLYYRISTVTLTVPPLRDRREDIVPFSLHLLSTLGAGDISLSTGAEVRLLSHPWPGNVRELKNVLERSLLLRTGNVIRASDVRFDQHAESAAAIPTTESTRTSSQTLQDVEREHIQRALEAERGRVEAAARRLGIPRSTLYQKVKTYGIQVTRIRMTVPRRLGERDSD